MAASRKPSPAVVPKKPTLETEPVELRILKRGSCSTLSGKSTLRYEVSADSEETIHLRVTECSGGGFFSNEWVPLPSIRSALDRAKSITAILLFPLFHGKSVNTPGYVLAVLKAEKLIQTLPDKTRMHEFCRDWDDRVTKLLGDAGKPKSSPAKSTGAKSRAGPTGIGKPTPANKRAKNPRPTAP